MPLKPSTRNAKTGVTSKQQRLEVCTVQQSDEALRSILQRLPIEEFDEEVWETFLQAEKVNSFDDPLIVIQYGTPGSSNDDTFVDCLGISKALNDLNDLLKRRNALYDDTFFWKTLKSFTSFAAFDDKNTDGQNQRVNQESSFPVRALLLLLVQCIHDGFPLLSIPATECFLTICQLPVAVEHFFSPNLFIGQRIIQPFSPQNETDEVNNNKKLLAPKAVEAEEDGLESDDEENRRPADNSKLSKYTSKDLKRLASVIEHFFSTIELRFLNLELGRELIFLVADVLSHFICREADYREAGAKCLLKLMCRLNHLRNSYLVAEKLDAEFQSSTHCMQQDESLNDTTDDEIQTCDDRHPNKCSFRPPLIQLFPGGPLGDLLLFGCGAIFRHFVPALCLGNRRIGITVASVPKPLLTLRQFVIAFVIQLVEIIPALLNPSELEIKAFQKTHCVDSEPERSRRRAKKKRPESEDEENFLVSDEECEESKEPGIKSRTEQSSRAQTRENKDIKTKSQKKSKVEGKDDPILALVARACLTVADRKEWREYLGKSIIEILIVAEKIEKNIPQFNKEFAPEMECANGDLVENDMNKLPLRGRLSIFIIQLMGGHKISYKTVAVDVCLALLELFVDKTKMALHHLTHSMKQMPIRLLQKMITKLADTQLGIRARSLECLASLFGTFVGSITSKGDETPLNTLHSVLLRSLLGHHPSQQAPLTSGITGGDPYFIDLATIIKNLATDDKQIVRKSVLTLTASIAESLTHLKHTILQSFDIHRRLDDLNICDKEIFRSLCLDGSLQVRVKAITTIHGLLVLFPDCLSVRRLWLDEVLPAINDAEKTVTEKLVELVSSVVIDGLADLANDPHALSLMIHAFKNQTDLPFPFNVLEATTSENIEYLQRALFAIYKKRGASLSSNFVKALRNMIQSVCMDELDPTLWPTSLFEIAQETYSYQTTSIPPRMLAQCWLIIARTLCKKSEDDKNSRIKKDVPQMNTQTNTLRLITIAKCLLVCLSVGGHHLGAEDKKDILTNMKSLIETFSAPLPLIGAVICALKSITQEKERTQISMENQSWLQRVLNAINSQLTHLLQSSAKDLVASLTPYHGQCDTQLLSSLTLCSHPRLLCRYLFTLGELVFSWDLPVPTSLIALIEALATDTLGAALLATASAQVKRQLPMNETPIGQIQPNTSASGIQSLFPSRTKVTYAPSTQKHHRYAIPGLVRAQAFICLGKLALRDHKLAKRLIETFVGHLTKTESTLVRINVLLVFADLSVRFTSLTDPYLLQFSSGLADPCPLIRKQNLILLSSLVAQDYIKCRGFIVFRLLYCLSDLCSSIRNLAEAVASNIIVPRQDSFIQNHFLEMLCFSSGWFGHPILRASAVGGNSQIHRNSPFCLIREPEKRQLIYMFFLRNMNDRDKHEISRRIVHDFLAAFIDSDDLTGRSAIALPPNASEPAGSALRDALKLLGCKQMKIFLSANVGAAAAAAAAKKQSTAAAPDAQISESVQVDGEETNEETTVYELNLLKRNLAFQILPTLLSLKRFIEDARSPFLKDIIQCISSLLFEYKSELSEILFHDPMLAKQLEADFKKGLFQESDIYDSSLEVAKCRKTDDTTQKHHMNKEPKRGRPSLLLETSPGIPTTTFPTKSTTGRQRRGSIELLTGNRAVGLSLPRLRAEALAALTGRRSMPGDTYRKFHQESGSMMCTALSTIQSIATSPTKQNDTNSSSTPYERQLTQKQEKKPFQKIGRTSEERYEQELVLTALRSSRRRHSLPSVCGPSQEEGFAAVGTQEEPVSDPTEKSADRMENVLQEKASEHSSMHEVTDDDHDGDTRDQQSRKDRHIVETSSRVARQNLLSSPRPRPNSLQGSRKRARKHFASNEDVSFEESFKTAIGKESLHQGKEGDSCVHVDDALHVNKSGRKVQSFVAQLESGKRSKPSSDEADGVTLKSEPKKRGRPTKIMSTKLSKKRSPSNHNETTSQEEKERSYPRRNQAVVSMSLSAAIQHARSSESGKRGSLSSEHHSAPKIEKMCRTKGTKQNVPFLMEPNRQKARDNEEENPISQKRQPRACPMPLPDVMQKALSKSSRLKEPAKAKKSLSRANSKSHSDNLEKDKPKADKRTETRSSRRQS